RPGLPGCNAPTLQRRELAAIASNSWLVHLSRYRCAVARSGYAADASLSLFHFPQRSGPVSWLLLVLLHERASAALPGHALPARLQHRAPAGLLAAPPIVAVAA